MNGVAYLAFLTLASNIFIIGLYLSWAAKLHLGYSKIWNSITPHIRTNGMYLALLVSLVATLGSLYLSEVAGLVPCVLCWYQRIFMYPLVPIITVALIKKTNDYLYYIIPLALIGAVIAIYHYILQFAPISTEFCNSVGFSASCSDRFVTNYGYITIPWMAFSAFVLIILFTVMGSASKRGK